MVERENEEEEKLPNAIDFKIEHVQDMITSKCGKEKKTQDD